MNRYRPDIDGLRAIAVLSVLFFHARVSAFSGGFVGVDIFFVISGFLITGMIEKGASAENFSFASFYAGRARRLLPALAFTCIAVLCAAGATFSTSDLSRTVASVITAITGVSNFEFWHEADYFDVNSHLKPLLHTWSLGVEVQFYLAWPALLLLCIRLGKAAVALLFAIAILGGVALSQNILHHDVSGAFYLPQSRIFEFAIGGMVAMYAPRDMAPIIPKDVLLLLGLGLIAVSIFRFSEATLFPGVAALVPCVGASLCILGGQSRLGGVLSNRVMSGIGLISYSVYLVHWPLIVFYEYVAEKKVTPSGALWILAIALALGFLMYRYVEQPFRRVRWKGPKLAAISMAAVVAVGCTAYSANAGWQWRVDQDSLKFPSAEQWRKLAYDSYCTHPDDSRMPTYLFSCQNFRGKKQSIILWGDSHAQHLVPGISEAFADYNVFVAEHDGCVYQSGFAGYVQNMGGDLTRSCVFENARTLKFLEDLPPTNIILTSTQHGGPKSLPAIKLVIDSLRAKGHNVIVIGDFIRPDDDLTSCLQRPSWMKSSCGGNRETMSQAMKYNDEMAALIPGFVNPNSVQCPDRHCQLWLNGAPMFRDAHHLTIPGSIAMVAKLKPLLSLGDGQSISAR